MNFKGQRDRMAFLAFASGEVFFGYSVGAPADVCGEAVVNSSSFGFQEILSDPASAGKLIAMAMPEVGCCGTCKEDMLSDKFQAAGLIAREISEPSNWRCEESLKEALARFKIPAIAGVDTRALAIFLREKGSQKALLCASGSLSAGEAVDRLRR